MPATAGPERVEQAHGKINLILRILARETSGYHGLETLFQRLTLHDRVRLQITDGATSLHCYGPTCPPDGLGPPESNLAWRAAAAYMDAAGWDAGWAIDIEKHIPVGGGLGGGSADAAAVLRALEALAPRPIGQARLLALAGTLGADVPFLCTDDARAWGWHRGDRLLPLPPLPVMGVTLVTFAQGINTGAAYAAVAASRAANQVQITSARLDPAQWHSWHALSEAAVNDFEAVAPSMHPGVATVLPMIHAEARALRSQGYPAIGLMSGSGATCFLLHPAELTPELTIPAGAQLVRTATATVSAAD